jgi:RNA recognition motif-containing protein
MKLYVGNLAFQTSSDDLQQLFAKAGTVETASVVEDRETGRSRGFGFVEMSSKEEGAAAIQQFNGQELGGRALNVNEAKPRENRSGGSNSRY